MIRHFESGTARERKSDPLDQREGFNAAGARGFETPAHGCPRRRAGVACEERTAVAEGNACSAVKKRAFAGAVVIEAGAINISNVSHRRRLRGDCLWLDPAMTGPW